MPQQHLCHVALGVMLAALQARWPGMTIEPNRTAPFAEAELPAFALLDEGHTAQEGPELGFVSLAGRAALLWYGDAANADVTREAHLMHAEALHELTAEPHMLPDGQPFWPVEASFALDTNSAEGAAGRIIGWRADITFDLIAPIGALTITV